MYVRKNCGRVEGYEFYNEFIYFHENVPKIRKKSLYH